MRLVFHIGTHKRGSTVLQIHPRNGQGVLAALIGGFRSQEARDPVPLTTPFKARWASVWNAISYWRRRARAVPAGGKPSFTEPVLP